jgi:8-oxo-dGTP diphosphatase
MDSRDHLVLRLAVDLCIFTISGGELRVLLVERANDPFRGQLALPGGFLRGTEDLDDTALRELKEETGLDGTRLHLEQLPAFGKPDRDPRGRVVSVPYLAIAPNLPAPVAGSDASGAQWMPVTQALSTRTTLAFDHDEILRVALERARERLEQTTLAAAFCGATFTISDLRAVYEVVWGVSLDPGNFSRKVMKTKGFVVPIGEKRAADAGRPAALYRRGPAQRLHPPLLRNTEP